MSIVDLVGATAETQDPTASMPTPISELRSRHWACVEGELRRVRTRELGGWPALECVVGDQTGSALVLFLGRRSIGGVEVGRRVRVAGVVGRRSGSLGFLNPVYRLLAVR